MDSEFFTILIFFAIIFTYICLLIICTYIKPFGLLFAIFKQLKNITIILYNVLRNIIFRLCLTNYSKDPFNNVKYRPF